MQQQTLNFSNPVRIINYLKLNQSINKSCLFSHRVKTWKNLGGEKKKISPSIDSRNFEFLPLFLGGAVPPLKIHPSVVCNGGLAIKVEERRGGRGAQLAKIGTPTGDRVSFRKEENTGRMQRVEWVSRGEKRSRDGEERGGEERWLSLSVARRGNRARSFASHASRTSLPLPLPARRKERRIPFDVALRGCQCTNHTPFTPFKAALV